MSHDHITETAIITSCSVYFCSDLTERNNQTNLKRSWEQRGHSGRGGSMEEGAHSSGGRMDRLKEK